MPQPAEGGPRPRCLFEQGGMCTSISTARRVLAHSESSMQTSPQTLADLRERANKPPSMALPTTAPGVFLCRRAQGETERCSGFEERKLPVDDEVPHSAAVTIPVSRNN